MKRSILAIAICAVLAFPALAQQPYMPCIWAPPATRPMAVYLPDGRGGWSWQIPPVAEPVVIEAFSQPYKLNAGAWGHFAFYMPVQGRCVGAFDSYDDRSDTYKAVQDAAGRWVNVPVESRGDVEIIIIADQEYARIKGAISTSSYMPIYTTHRSSGGTFSVDLRPGWYHLVVYNGYSLSAKSVDLKFGGKLPDVRQ